MSAVKTDVNPSDTVERMYAEHTISSDRQISTEREYVQ